MLQYDCSATTGGTFVKYDCPPEPPNWPLFPRWPVIHPPFSAPLIVSRPVRERAEALGAVRLQATGGT